MAHLAGLVTNSLTDQRAQICVLRCTSPRQCADGLFLGWTPDGQAAIDHAKRTGTWCSLSDAQDLVVPDDLRDRLGSDKTALRDFAAFPPSARRSILVWIASAMRPETRERRIAQTVELTTRNVRANQPSARRATGG